MGETLDVDALMRRFIELQYERNDAVLERGNFRRRGDTLEIFPDFYATFSYCEQINRSHPYFVF
ncbi:hypothetical protein FACS189444_5430 [Spirochaetia bacterium]|nr:hypothetical protein FACS189444_5430 [Spirochaetia bacterium]